MTEAEDAQDVRDAALKVLKEHTHGHVVKKDWAAHCGGPVMCSHCRIEEELLGLIGQGGTKFEDPNLNAAIHAILPQLLITLIARFAGAGRVYVSAKELDTVPVGKMLMMEQHGEDELVFRVVDKPGDANVEQALQKLVHDPNCDRYWVYHMSGPYEGPVRPEE